MNFVIIGLNLQLIFEKIKDMLKDKLNISYYKKNTLEECFSKNLLFLVKSLKKIIQILFIVPNIFICTYELKAESQGREVQNLVRSGAELQERKRKAYEKSQKESGLKIKRYLINKSALQSKKGKSATATQNMVESGLLTLDMVKNNSWFVKRGFQTSYSENQGYEKSKNISRDAQKMSKNRARITGRVKPDYLFAETASRDALAITRKRARISGPVKPGVIYSGDVSRDAKKISKTRAVVTGPVKPEKLFSEQVSRDAKKISIKTAKKYTTDRRDLSVYPDLIESMSKRPTSNNRPVDIGNYSKK